MSKSFFFYVHNDLSGDPSWKKCGKGMTPYSVVRARQKYCSKKFQLNHLYFGNPSHISYLEEKFKNKFYKFSGTYLNSISSQTELFKMSELQIIEAVDYIIESNSLHITKLELQQPYSAANSGECPFGIPSEVNSYDYLKDKIIKKWGSCETSYKITASTAQYNKLFLEIFK